MWAPSTSPPGSSGAGGKVISVNRDEDNTREVQGLRQVHRPSKCPCLSVQEDAAEETIFSRRAGVLMTDDRMGGRGQGLRAAFLRDQGWEMQRVPRRSDSGPPPRTAPPHAGAFKVYSSIFQLKRQMNYNLTRPTPRPAARPSPPFSPGKSLWPRHCPAPAPPPASPGGSMQGDAPC